MLRPVDLPDPEPGPGQVVVGMAAADVIFLDTMLRAGLGQDIFPRELPYVPGGGGAGEVLKAGTGVDPAWVGRRVVVRTGTGYAEQVVAAVEEIAAVPGGVTDQAAAALVHDGVTAFMMNRIGLPAKEEWVLVTSAAGGAGSLLVQLAAAAGARVVAAASRDDKLALARELGAEAAVDYTRPGWAERVRELTGGGVALAYEGAGGALGAATLDAVADGGRVVTYGTADGFTTPDPDLIERRGLRLFTPLMDGPPDQDTVSELLHLALDETAHGRLRPSVGATYPLARAADAHRALAARTTVGKSLLLVGDG